MEFLKDLKIYAKNLRVMVVEDDIELNQLLCGTLKIFFKSVDFAHDGEEGLKLYNTHKHDLIISDINMPKMDGITMASKIKNIDYTQSIVMLSAHTDAEYFIQLIEIGVNGFSPKPYNPENFMMILTREAENVMMRKEYDRLKNKELQLQLKNDQSDTTHKTNTKLKDKMSSDVSTLKTNIENIKSGDLDTSSNLLEEFKSDPAVWCMLKLEIENIVYLNNDLEECTDLLVLKGPESLLIDEIKEILQRYVSIFGTIPLFKNISVAFQKLSDILEDTDLDNIDEEATASILNLEFILEDTKKFINDVFIIQKNMTHKFFENSLISNVDQMEISLGLSSGPGNEVDFF